MKNKPSSTPAEETNWFNRLLNRTFFYLNLATLPPALLVAIAPYIMPDTWWLPALFSLHAPYWLLIPAFWTALWLMFAYKKALLNFLFLVINYPVIVHTFQFHGALESTTRDFKLMSYNIQVFNNRASSSDTCLNLIKAQRPDILCVQEFWNPKLKKANRDSVVKNMKIRFKEELGLPYAVFFPSKVFGAFGLAVFSRFPIIKGKQLVYSEVNTTNGLMFADIHLFGDTIRIYNVHLESYNFQERKMDFWAESSSQSYSFRSIWAVTKVMLATWRKQNEQIAAYLKDRKQCHYSTIVCGDLNVSPYHPHYQAVRNELNDSFEERGAGLGKTYGSNLFNNHRIDYILTSPKITVADHQVLPFQYSDHQPVVSVLRLEK